MALGMNDFRSIVIKADAANTSIAPIRLSQSDQDGRRIVFELWNGAESIAATGLTARLLFGVGEGGYATMTAVTGAATATWAVDVPQEALQTAGVVRMAVEVASGAQAVCTRIFDAVVEPALIDEDSPEAQDALSDFRAAVARLDDFTVPVPVANGGTGSTVGALSATDNINVKTSTIDQTDTTPTTAQTGKGYYITDANGRSIGTFRGYRTSLRDIGLEVSALRNVSGSSVSNALRLLIGEDGARSIYVSDSAMWASMIGIQTVMLSASNPTAEINFKANLALIYAKRAGAVYVGMVDFWSADAVTIFSSGDAPTVTKAASSHAITVTNNISTGASAIQVTVISIIASS